MALFSILLPVHRSSDLLPFAIESVQAQDLKDFVLYVICDGAPQETAERAHEYARIDSRIKVLMYPKGERHGEAYRHEVLKKADSTYVCQIADDDIWFPNHLTEMESMLENVDFGHVLQVYIVPPASIGVRASNLADETQRRQMCETKFNTFGPTECGYRMSAYRSLTEGWSPAPHDVWTDLHMWRKFFAMPGLTFETRYTVTSLHFPSPPRKDMSLQQRASENEFWFNNVRIPKERERIVQLAFQALSDDALKKKPLVDQVKKLDRQIADLARQVKERTRQSHKLGKQVQSLVEEKTRLVDRLCHLTDKLHHLKRVRNYYQGSRIWAIIEFIRKIRRRIYGVSEPAWLKGESKTS